MDLNLKDKAIKILGKIKQEKILRIQGQATISYTWPQKNKLLKEKLINQTSSKLKMLALKDSTMKTKRQGKDWEKIFKKHI